MVNLEDSQPFTDAGAWEFAADLLESGVPLQEVELQNPPGKAAYQIVVARGKEEIYIKLELGAGKVIGRSRQTNY